MRILHLMNGCEYKESILVAAKELENNNTVYVLGYNNGCTNGLSDIKYQVDELQQTYRKNCEISYLDTVNVSMTMNNLIQSFWYRDALSMNSRYNLLKPYEVQCLCCKLAAYIHGIAVAKALGIGIITDGVRESKDSIVSRQCILDLLSNLAGAFDVDLSFPIFDIDSDYELDKMLCDRGLLHDIGNPHCCLKMPIEKNQLRQDALNQYVDFFKGELEDIAKYDIVKAVDMYKNKFA